MGTHRSREVEWTGITMLVLIKEQKIPACFTPDIVLYCGGRRWCMLHPCNRIRIRHALPAYFRAPRHVVANALCSLYGSSIAQHPYMAVSTLKAHLSLRSRGAWACDHLFYGCFAVQTVKAFLPLCYYCIFGYTQLYPKPDCCTLLLKAKRRKSSDVSLDSHTFISKTVCSFSTERNFGASHSW